LGDAGFARVNDRFTVERMVENTANVYSRITSHLSTLNPQR